MKKPSPGLVKAVEQLSKQLPLAAYAALVIISIIISIPFTEQYVDWLDFDMNAKEDQYSEKTYVLQVNFTDETDKVQDAQVAELENILNRRLDRYGVEIVRILDHKVAEDGKDDMVELAAEESEVINIGEEENVGEAEVEETFRYLKLTVQTTKDLELVDPLVRVRNNMRIVIPKEDVVFDDPENPLAPYLEENYEYTDITRNSFRNVIVKELPTSTGETAFFSIYKVKPAFRKPLYDLLDDYAGTTIGISTDGFVAPYNVPVEFDRETQTSSSFVPEFSPVVGQDPDDAEIAQILLNAGVIRADYEIYEESQNEDYEFVQTDYKTVVVIMIGGIIALGVFLYFLNSSSRNLALEFVLNIFITNAFWMVILKYFAIDIDLSLAVLSGSFAIGYTCILIYAKDKYHLVKGTYIVSLVVLALLTSGLVRLMFSQLLVVSTIATIVQLMNVWFLNNIKKIAGK